MIPFPPSVARNLSHPPYLGSQFWHRCVQKRVSSSSCPLRSYIAVAVDPAVGKEGWQGEGEEASRDREGVIILFPLTAESHASAPGGADFVVLTVSRR